jgi:hypothetical protein
MGELLLARVLDGLVVEGDDACGDGGLLGRGHEQDTCGREYCREWLEESVISS